MVIRENPRDYGLGDGRLGPAEVRESETTRRERIVWEAEIIRRLIPLGQGKKGVWMEGMEKA